MEAMARVLTDSGHPLTIKSVEVTVAAPVSASLNIVNGTNGDITFTSIKGEDIGNATTVTLTSSTNAASVSLSGYDIGVDLFVDGTNGIDTTASNVKTLVEANTNITALVSIATNTAGVMAAAAEASLAGGDDNLDVVVDKNLAAVSLIRNSVGSLTLDMSDYHFGDFQGAIVDVSGTSTSSGVCKVEVSPVDSDTFALRMYNYSGALVDVAAAGKMRLKLLDLK